MSTSLFMYMCFMEERRASSMLIMMNGELVEVRVREKKGAEPLTEKEKHTAEAFIRKYDYFMTSCKIQVE